MGKVILYGFDTSPAVRSVILTLNALGLNYEYKSINLLTGENKTPEYLAINPLGTVPTLEDHGVFLTNSHAINSYLVRSYGRDDSLYPRDYLKRAIVDERLFYNDTTMLYGGLRNITYPLFFHNVKDVPQSKIDNIQKIYNILEKFLRQKKYVASNKLTIADFHLVATVTSLTALLAIDGAQFPQLSAWIKRLEQLPYFKKANSGVQTLHDLIKSTNFKIVP